MTLYLIGIGLSNQKDISVKGLEAVKKCDLIYLENYTSKLQCTVEDLEKFYGKKIILADREQSEQGSQKIIEEAKNKQVAFLIVGDPFSATTHIELFKSAKEKKVEVKVINNASVLTAVGITGLQLYNLGKVTSIPFDQPNVETPYHVLKENLSLGLHTLFLLDLKPDENKFMSIKESLSILEEIESKKQQKIINENCVVIACARLGSEDYLIKAGTFKELKDIDFGKPPYCLIVPGKLHFVEEEMIKFYQGAKLTSRVKAFD